jgi:outer membrane protein OmpA-like peptidoglycan-associated protein/tetratricopeptide (TPR) repeat protein
MKNTLRYITLALLWGLVSSLTAQNVTFTTDNFVNRESVLEQALLLLQEGDKNYALAAKYCASPLHCTDNAAAAVLYEEATKSYLAAYRLNPYNAQLNFRIGECYMYIASNKAIAYFERALMLDERTNVNVYLYIGVAYQRQDLFDEAIAYYKKYKAKLSVKQFNDYNTIVDKYIEECRHAPVFMNDPVRVFVDNLGADVNTQFAEFRPVVGADEQELFLNRTVFDGKAYTNEIVRLSKNAAATARYDSSALLAVPKAGRGRSLNTLLYLSDDRSSILFSSVRKQRTDLFESHWRDGKWTKPVRLKKPVRSKYNESSAYLSPEGNVLFFSSDRPDGYGGFDIYMVRLNEKGQWSDILNAGAGVNTPFDEHITFVSPDGNTIYYSSNGHNSMGGFDIFKSTYNTATNTWEEAVNLGYPINSTGDETSFCAVSDRVFYVSSSRAGGQGHQDIYKISAMQAEKQVVSTYENNLLAYHSPRFAEYVIEPAVAVKAGGGELVAISGMIVNQQSQQPMRAQIHITNNANGRVIAQFESNSETGRFTVAVPEGANYGMAVTAPGYMFQSENISIPVGSKKELNRLVETPLLETGRTIALRNVFFDFGQAKPTASSKRELELLYQMMNRQATMKIQVSGHTDNRGAEAANQRLSEQRAKAVVDYLVQSGVEPERLSYIGQGAGKPMTTNDTAEGRRLNRRTEITIISL